MKNHSLFLALLCLVALGSDLQSCQQEIFPFAKNPELSWSQFEKNFRETYQNIDIPTIILDNNCDFAPMYIWDPKDEDLTKFNEHRVDKQEPPFVIMNIKATGLTTPNEVEHLLLHEIGHHNYNAIQREQNHTRATHIADHVNIGFNWAVKGLNLGLLCRNFYPIMQKTVSKKALLAQAVALTMYTQITGIQKTISTVCDDVIGTRPEEFAADDFANQHATKETLQAAHTIYSKKHFIDRNYFDFVQDFKTDPKIQTHDPETQEIYIKIGQFLNSSQRYLLSGIYNIHRLLVPSHPSPSQRRHIVGQALKDRFGIETK